MPGTSSRKFRLLLVIFSTLLAIQGIQAQEIDYDELMSGFKALHVNKVVLAKTLNMAELQNLIYRELLNSPQLAVLTYQDQNLAHSIESMRQYFRPVLNTNLSYIDHASYYREAIVNARIPVKWDDKNPIISNITLPNGGQGIIWLPRPLVWEYHDIPLNASFDYRSRIINGNMSMNYQTSFGLNLRLFNYDLDYRYEPNTYGFPWSSTLDLGFVLPLGKNLGYFGNSINVEKEISKIESKIININYKNLRNTISLDILNKYFKLYVSYLKLQNLYKINKILKTQTEDVDLLTEDKRVTVLDNINIKSKNRSSNYQIDYAINNLYLLNSQLNLNIIASDTLYYFVPSDADIKKAYESLSAFANNILDDSNLASIIDSHPEMQISDLRIEQSELNVKHAKNQTNPDINLIGSVGSFQVSNLGYKKVWHSWRHIFYKPDGVNWNLGVQYNLPLGNSLDEQYQSELALKKMNFESKESIRKQISERIKEYKFYLFNAESAIENSMHNAAEIKEIIDKQAQPLFDNKRINRFDYNAYLNEYENASLNLADSYLSYFDVFFSFATEMNLDLSNFILEFGK